MPFNKKFRKVSMMNKNKPKMRFYNKFKQKPRTNKKIIYYK